MKKVKIGVVGAYRGATMIKYCKETDNAVLVAICDKNEDVLSENKAMLGDDSITYYTSFDEFINHDMDAVVLANYATEHAPFAIKCLKAGKHVFSEVLPCQTMSEAVALIEAVEQSGLVYTYAENYCYMAASREMTRLYREGKIGELEYAEGEYIHNCEGLWPSITYGDPNHWRNNMYANFYCTHSIGPIIHATKLCPVRVTGFESGMTERKLRVGAKSGLFGIEMIELNNGAIVKSIHGDLYKNSIWYTMYGAKGRMESAREDAEHKDSGMHKIYVNVDEYSGEYPKGVNVDEYLPKNEEAERFGHGGSDFYPMYHFVERILGDDTADTIDVYEALDMFLPGLFAYRSVLAGGIPMDIPNLRDKAERDKWRYDVFCTDPKVAGDRLLPVFSKGNPDIPETVYESVRKKWNDVKNQGEVYVKYVKGTKENKK